MGGRDRVREWVAEIEGVSGWVGEIEGGGEMDRGELCTEARSIVERQIMHNPCPEKGPLE